MPRPSYPHPMELCEAFDVLRNQTAKDEFIDSAEALADAVSDFFAKQIGFGELKTAYARFHKAQVDVHAQVIAEQ